MPDRPLTARDILNGLGPQQSLTPGDDPRWSTALAHKFEQGASGLGAGPAVTQSAGEIGDTVGGILGSLSLHDAIPNLTEAWNRLRYGQPIQAAGSVLAALPMPANAVEKDVAENVVKNSVNVPSIRGLPVEQGVEAARSEPHLIPAGNQSKGYYIGGPQDVQSPADLVKRRAEFDAYMAPELRGSDWYDRYRAGMNRATGGDPDMNKWMSNTQGSWSAGVAPESETAFALKEANSALAGQPTRAYMGGAHEDFLRAIEAGDPDMMRLGPKTGEYASLVNPDQPGPPGATGVNDFRYANQWGYTPGEAVERKGDLGLTAPQHTFLDYENALAVDRANKAALGGKTDWTGEQLQAVPWVRQKAEALMGLRPGLDYESAITEANKTAPDFFEKHAANATWEAQPGVSTGHLPGSSAAGPEEREAYMNAPGSWAVAPSMGLETGELPRDAIYGGLRLGDTGVGAYTLPSRPMTGVFEGQNNPGAVGRPLVAFDVNKNVKSVSPADQNILNAGETLRSAVGAQDAGAWNKTWPADKIGSANSYFQPLDRPATVEELTAAQGAGAGYGMPMSTDTGGGILTSNFDAPQGWKPAERKQAIEAMKGVQPADATAPGQLMKTDSNYIDLTPEWKQGVGSGAVTQKMLDAIGGTPELQEAFNRNPYIPGVASAQAERDASTGLNWGAPRPDLQNLRLEMGQGPGWVDRARDNLATFKATGKLPALAGGAATGAAVFTPTAGYPAQPDQPPSQSVNQSPGFDDWWQQLQAQRFGQAS